jgi:macrolide transport system ATP-binding/permease protein
MRRLRRLWDAVRARGRFERDMRDELRAHLQHRADDLERAGLSPTEAARQARLEFGALESYKEQCRDAAGLTLVRPFLGLAGDVRLGARRLLATPLFFGFAVISLALGVSVTTTVYSTLYALLWKPLGITDAAQIAVVKASNGFGTSWRRTLSTPDFDDLRRQQRSFADLAAYQTVFQTLEMPRVSEWVTVEAVSGNYFPIVGIAAAMGRVIQPLDDAQGAQVMVLSHQIWRGRFDADAAIVGKTVRLGSQTFEIVGVAPPRYGGLQTLGTSTPVGWVPLETASRIAAASATPADPRDRRDLTVFGRLAPASTVTTAAAELATIGASLDAASPARTFRPVDGSTTVIRRQWSAEDVTAATRPPLGLPLDLLVLGMTALVLLVACTNLANLMLSRGALRLHEISVRRALGAARWRLVREQLAESVLITIAGTVATYAMTRVFLRLATLEIPTAHRTFAIEPELNVPAMAFASLALLASILVFGLEPALNLTRKTLNAQLTSEPGAAPPASGRRQRRLIRWQVALSACFFTVTAVLLKVVVAEARHDSGVALERLAVTTLHFGIQGWDEPRARRAIDRSLELARRNREVESASVSTGLPFGFQMTPSAEITTPDRPFVKGVRSESTIVLAGSPELLRTLDVPLLRGRHFTDRDDAGSSRVAIVSELTERRLFGAGAALGRQIVLRDRERNVAETLTLTVVGIAKQTDVDMLMLRDDHLVYLPFAQRYRANVALVARTKGNPASAVHILRDAVRQADPDLGAGTSGPAYWLTAGPYVAARIAGGLAAALGALTLILAMVGLYGVQAQAVAHRTREVGVRMALGAGVSQIERMVLREGFRPVIEGLMIGLFLGTVARGAMRALIAAPIPIIDPFAIALVPIPLGIAALMACYLPARRAARVDPNVALRHL